jgi:uncharacterized membrane protein YozB (DUF420 family)
MGAIMLLSLVTFINYLWRTTPAVLIGLLLAGIAFIFRRRLSFYRELQSVTLVLILFAVLYTIFMTIGDKKFDRHLLPVFAPPVLMAAVGVEAKPVKN